MWRDVRHVAHRVAPLWCHVVRLRGKTQCLPDGIGRHDGFKIP